MVKVNMVLVKVLLMQRAEKRKKRLVTNVWSRYSTMFERAYLCTTLLNVIPVDLIWHFNPVQLHMEELKESLL